MTNTRLLKKIMSVTLVLALLMTYLPFSALAAPVGDAYFNRVVDVNTMDGWLEYFNTTDLTTENAGGVWTDKSVFSDTAAFNDKVTMQDPDRNFLTALSAIAANKEVVGYSTVPTDTVLVLDVSGSMRGQESALVNAANNAIATLLAENENNRVGVVLYSASNSFGSSTYEESVTRLLPIDRYTTGADGRYLYLSANGRDDNGTIYRVNVDGDVDGTVNTSFPAQKNVLGGTYIQAGLWEAKEMFEEKDTVIGDNNWQAGDNRMPILVLMSDGAPSTGTTAYADVENSKYITYQGYGNNRREVENDGSNVGNGSESDLTAGNAFLTQLTASYVMNKIEEHYQQINPDVRGLFYTLGFNIGNNNVAQAVMNPDDSTLTDNLWESYQNENVTNLVFSVKNRNGNHSDVSITKNSYATSKSYVDQYFSASGDGLANAFRSIVEEILLQSRYYPTHLEGGSPDFSGYVEFTDVLGEYMEIKGIKGILLGDTLYDGHMMASKLNSDHDGGLGTPEDPTALGDEFVRAVKTRLNIADTGVAQALVQDAYAAEQLCYKTQGGTVVKWSNYIGWYAKEDMTFSAFCNDDPASPAALTTPHAGDVYKVRSYGFLGETAGSIKNSDMMYMSVQVRTNLQTGEQTVLWKIPAALVPLVTYEVSLEGANVDEARNVRVAIDDDHVVAPIRLVYESGLRSDLNELNINRITDEEHIAADGVTRQFWNNWFDISAPDHAHHKTTTAEFTPSKENERFYYTFDSAVHKKVGNSYVLVGENEGANGELNTTAEYYHRRYIFTDDSAAPVFIYEKMSAQSIAEAVWDANFETLTGDKGAWVVPAGTPARELEMYSKLKADEDATQAAHMVFYPYLTEQNGTYYVDMNLGNNGLLQVTPAQGIKVTKSLYPAQLSTDGTFTFRLTMHNANGTPYTGSLNSYVDAAGTVPTTAPTAVTLNAQGVYTFTLKADQTMWLSGAPTGATYTVEEVTKVDGYKLHSVHVNGQSDGTVAAGTIAAYYMDDVQFVNTMLGEGDLAITKRVVDANGAAVDVADSLTFTAEVTLTDAAGAPVSGTFETNSGNITVPSTGTVTVPLKAGVPFVIKGLPEDTSYTVVETNVPAGFTLNNASSVLSGTIDATGNDQAIIVNTYTPVGTDGRDVDVAVYKEISGNRTDWMTGESYTFVLERMSAPRAATVSTVTISATDAAKNKLFDLSGERYDQAGSYTYRLYEQTGTQGGVTYDTADRFFRVDVADSDMDGDLEIVSVSNLSGTTVSGSYLVTARFNNVYQPTGSATATVDVRKKMSGQHALSGYQFALYSDADIANATEIVRSTITNAAGEASFRLTYPADRATMAGRVYTYYLAEINSGKPNIDYSDAIYRVEVTVKDNGDGTISTATQITSVSGGVLENGVPTFENTYVPSSSDFITIAGMKRIDGDRVLNAGEFSFELTADATTPHAPLPTTTVVRNAADGSFAFSAIEFTDAHKGQSYVYSVKEVGTDPIGGFTYDAAEYKVHVTVVDNGDMTLTAQVTRIDKVTAAGTQTVNDIVFTNRYDATDATVTLRGTKMLTGKTMQDGEFTFALTPITVGAPMPASATATNTADGDIVFGAITYAKAGTYVYRLTEVAGTDARYDYDESVYVVTVTVTDNSHGTLSAAVSLEKNQMSSTAIVFNNGFVPTPITYDIHADFGGTKALVGRPMRAGEFEFVLINAVTGAQIGESVRNDASGVFRFPAVTLSTTGIHHFKITEVVGTEKGVSYDTASYHVRLEVEQDDSGVLSITDKKLYKGTVSKQEIGGVLTEVTAYEDVTQSGDITFNNTYTADPAYVSLEATKILIGRDLVDGEFKFDLHKTDATYAYDENTLVQHDVVLSLQDDGTGSVVFMPEKFDTAGTYYYVIVEDEIDERGVTADDTAYRVEITVTDNHAGNLVATLKVNGTPVTGSTADTVRFTNTYAAAATDIVIAGTKTLTGRDLAAEEFIFELYDASGAKLQSVKNAADGSFAFEAIPVDTAGVYTYTVRELAGDAEGVTYDDAVYTVEATVTDNWDGTFTVAYSYRKGTETANGITFINAYTAPVTTPTPEPTPTPEVEDTSPKTGDSTELGLLVALLFISGGGMVPLAVCNKKRKAE